MKKLNILLAWLLMLAVLLTACGGRGNAPSPSPTPDVTAAMSEQSPEASPSPEASQEPSGTPTEDAESPEAPAEPDESTSPEAPTPAEEDLSAKLPVYGESYYDLTNVVLYLEVYGELPPNFITKNEARSHGWEGGSVEDYVKDAAIGGDIFGNREGLLPEAAGRRYTECDIDTHHYSSRGSRRLVFSNDGLYFYTSDHYESFVEVTVTEDYEVIK